MPKCCDCQKETFLYSLTCTRAMTPGSKPISGSFCLCKECADKELKAQGLPAIKE